jgi:hypothetical protein
MVTLFMERFETLLVQAQSLLTTLLRPWSLYQVGIALGVFCVALILSKGIEPRFRAWLKTREGWPAWRLRVGLTVLKRVKMILFVILIWTVVLIMREVTWPSRSYILGVIANLGGLARCCICNPPDWQPVAAPDCALRGVGMVYIGHFESV